MFEFVASRPTGLCLCTVLKQVNSAGNVINSILNLRFNRFFNNVAFQYLIRIQTILIQAPTKYKKLTFK